MCRTRPERLVPLLAAAFALVAGTVGCSGPEPAGRTPAPPSRGDVVQALSRALDQRADAVRRADADGFARGVGGRPAFRARQQVWFDNLTRLPVQRLAYRVDPASLVRDGDRYSVTISETLQLAGYDDEPVVSPDRYRFASLPRHPDRYRLVSVTDADWEARHDVRRQPWEDGPVEVREGQGVLGIFDAGSVGAASALLGSVEAGIEEVSAHVPYRWSRSVVVYALSDPTFLHSLEDAPGDDPGDLDGVAFAAGRGTRFVLNPRVLRTPGPARDRLVRHELAHVAIGTRDDAVPVWLAEGLAEYVAVRPLAPEDRQIPAAAVTAAADGVDDLPADAAFDDRDSAAHYGLAWWAVEHIAEVHGEDAPWRLLDALARPGADPAAVLRDRLGVSTRDLGRQAARLIRGLYGPTAEAR